MARPLPPREQSAGLLQREGDDEDGGDDAERQRGGEEEARGEGANASRGVDDEHVEDEDVHPRRPVEVLVGHADDVDGGHHRDHLAEGDELLKLGEEAEPRERLERWLDASDRATHAAWWVAQQHVARDAQHKDRANGAEDDGGKAAARRALGAARGRIVKVVVGEVAALAEHARLVRDARRGGESSGGARVDAAAARRPRHLVGVRALADVLRARAEPPLARLQDER